MPPIEKPVRSLGLARRRAPDVGRGGDGSQTGKVDTVVTRHEAEQRLGAVAGRDHEDQRLDDLPELGADGRGRLGGGVGRLVEGGHLERHALAGGGVEDALDRGMDRGVGHGPESSIGPPAPGGGGRVLRPPAACRRPTPSSRTSQDELPVAHRSSR